MNSSTFPSLKVNLGPASGLGAQVTVSKRQTSLSPVFDKAPTLSPVGSDGELKKMVISRSGDQNSSMPVVRVKTLAISQIRNTISRTPIVVSSIPNADPPITPMRMNSSGNSSADSEAGRGNGVESVAANGGGNKDDGCDTESSGSPDDVLDSGGKRSNRKQTFPPTSPTSSHPPTLAPAVARRGQPRIIRLDCGRGVLEDESTEGKEINGSKANGVAEVDSPPNLPPASNGSNYKGNSNGKNDSEGGKLHAKKDAPGGPMIRRIVITRPTAPPVLDDQTQHRVMNQIPSPPPALENAANANKPVKVILDLSKGAPWTVADESQCSDVKPATSGDDGELRRRRPNKRRFPSLPSASSNPVKTEVVKRRRRRTKLEMEEARRAIFVNSLLKKKTGRPSMEQPNADRTTSTERTLVNKAVMLPDESCSLLKDCPMRTGNRSVPCWHQVINSKICNAKGFPRSAHEIAQWSIEKVADFINSLSYMRHDDDQYIGDRFADQLVDGEALLLLSQDDFVHKLNVKLGPAVKLHNMLLYLKHLTEQ